MKKKLLPLLTATLLTIAAQAQDCAPKSIDLSIRECALVKGNNDFAFRLFRSVRNDNNQVISPLSITYALGMLNNGAAGVTRQEISQTLGFGDTGADGINDFCKKMRTELPALDEQTKIMISNAIFLNEPRYFLPDFEQKAHDYYDATTETRNFSDGETMKVINQWGSDHTMGMIPTILDEQSFNPLAASYLLNAVYFKGIWTLKFDKSETQEELFDGAVTVPMMHMLKGLPYYENANFQALALPYGTGAYQMTVILPREGKSISDVAAQMNNDMWEELYMSMASIDVKLPRLDITTQLNLVETMSALGMPSAFSQVAADIPNFCDRPQYISKMKQVAKIKLDEEGTEAAAITIIETENTAIGDEPVTIEFHANRPFLYVISEQSTGVILFIGQFTGKNATGTMPSSVKVPTRKPSEPSAVYDLSGRRLKGRPTKGFYISDGRKVIR